MSKDYYKVQIQDRLNRLNSINKLVKQIRVSAKDGYDGKLADYHIKIESIDSVLKPILSNDGSLFAESGLTVFKGNIVHFHDIVTNYKLVNNRQLEFLSVLNDEKSILEEQEWQLQREYNNNKDPLDVIGIKLMDFYKPNLG